MAYRSANDAALGSGFSRSGNTSIMEVNGRQMVVYYDNLYKLEEKFDDMRKDALQNHYYTEEKFVNAVEKAREAQINRSNLLEQKRLRETYAENLKNLKEQTQLELEAKVNLFKEMNDMSLEVHQKELARIEAEGEAKLKAIERSAEVEKREADRLKEIAEKRETYISEQMREISANANGKAYTQKGVRLRGNANDANKAYEQGKEQYLKGEINEAQLEVLAKQKVASDKAVENAEKQEELLTTLKQKRESFFKDLAEKVGNTAKSAIEKGISLITSYQASIDARLQGTDTNFTSMLDLIQHNLGASRYVSNSKVMENINSAVEAGIAYNVEQRAFLQSVSENIASTFNAFDSNLLRIIRIQQSDSTAARLGMEASLTRAFNNWYSDTSYLSDEFDAVLGTLSEASATMSLKEGTEFEYAVQKWLGSLYSVGMSNSSISSLAQGLTYLATGDVNAMSGNTALQNLFAMSMSKSGKLDYATVLKEGLKAADVDTLMSSMVEYLSDIAKNLDTNNVVANIYGGVMGGMTVADLRSITNISAENISDITSMNLSYVDMLSETESQLESLSTRLSVYTQLNNVLENFQFTTGTTMAQSPVAYVTMKMADILDEVAGGLDLGLTFKLFGAEWDMPTVSNLLRTGVYGISMLSNMGSIFRSLTSDSSKNGMNLNAWNATETISRGTGFGDLTSGSGYSSSIQYKANTSADDIESGSLTDAKNRAKDTSNVVNKDEEYQYTTSDIYKALFRDETPGVLSTMNETVTELSKGLIDTGDIGRVSLIAKNNTIMLDHITSIKTQLDKFKQDEAMNVKISGLAELDSDGGIPIYLSEKKGAKTQIKQVITDAIPVVASDDGDISLKNFIKLFVQGVGTDSNTKSLNVFLKGNEAKAISFLTKDTNHAL